MPNLEELRYKLLAAIDWKFEEDKVKFDAEHQKFYFMNIPGEFLPWSARNTEFSEVEKAIIKENVLGDLVYMHNMRYYLIPTTNRATTGVINAAFDKL